MTLSPEQWLMIAASVAGLIVAAFVAITKLINTLSDFVDRRADQKIEEKSQKLALEKLDTETEILERKSEAEARRRQDIALSETVERVLVMFSQTQERHAKVDERHAENAEKKVESDKQLAAAIENLTRSAMTSQLWQENRANDFLDTANLINEKMGELSRVGKSAMDALDRLEIGLIEARGKLNSVIEHHTNAAQQSTLLAIQTQLTSLAIMVESLNPKPPAPMVLVEREKEPSLDDTIELSDEEMLAATKKLPEIDLTEIPDHIATPKTVTDEKPKDAA